MKSVGTVPYDIINMAHQCTMSQVWILSVMICAQLALANPVCQNQGICCIDCMNLCPFDGISCLSGCTGPPCSAGKDCNQVGGTASDKIAQNACALALNDCGITPIGGGGPNSLEDIRRDLRTCCVESLTICIERAPNRPCNAPGGNFGTCGEQGFKDKYAERADGLCRFILCDTFDCKDIIQQKDERCLGSFQLGP